MGSPGPALATKLLLFASARSAAGDRPFLALSVPTGSTLQDLLDAAVDKAPELRRLLPHCRVSIDGEYAIRPYGSRRLNGQEEVAILPPYSGG